MREVERPEWDVACLECGLMVGEIVGGHFLHHAECAEPKRVEGGTRRCCACGGRLTGSRRPMMPAPVAPMARITPFAARRVASKGR